MPFINTKVNVDIPAEKEALLKQGYGKAISLIPGKSEARLMLCFEPNCKMYFHGDNNMPIAMVEVSLFGNAGNDSCSALTGEISNILHTHLGISPQNIFVKYISTTQWGHNGVNF